MNLEDTVAFLPAYRAVVLQDHYVFFKFNTIVLRKADRPDQRNWYALATKETHQPKNPHGGWLFVVNMVDCESTRLDDGS